MFFYKHSSGFDISNDLANLRDREKIHSLHIISHGNPGTLYLGNTPLNPENLAVVTGNTDLKGNWQLRV
ncbi:MAG: DUF4347 domain-containing protein [Cyanobacteria bacterium SBLK]|nr:DUF4347 domain-containing protein [Cyanobacteria bacterium SBLK]